MGSGEQRDVLVVCAERERDTAAAVCEAVGAGGHSARVQVVGDESSVVRDDGAAVVVLLGPALLVTGWSVGDEAARIAGRAVVVQIGGALTSGPLGAAPVLRWEVGQAWPGLESAASPAAPVPGDPRRRVALAAEQLTGVMLLPDLLPRDQADEVRAVVESALAVAPFPGLPVGDGLRLVEQVGVGPLAATWRAVGPDGRVVAARFPHPQWLDTPALETLLEATRAIARVGDERVAPILAVTERAGRPLVVRGWGASTLEDRVQDRAIDPITALQAILDAAGALQALHAEGITHGAVKPSNLLLDVAGAGQLADPAAAGVQVADARDALYLAPETQEDGAQADARADLYALGMCALCGLSGAPLPFWVLRDPERLLAELEVAEPIRAALRRAVEVRPEDRWPDVDAFTEALLGDGNTVRLLCERATLAGRHGVATAYLAHLVDRTGERSPSLLLALGRAQLAAGEVAPARAAFTEALHAEDRAERLAAARGLADVAGADGDEQLRVDQLLTHAATCEPLGVELLVEAARAQQQLGLVDEAQRTWARVLEHHLDKGQAIAALEALVAHARAVEDWPAAFRFGRQQHGYLPPEQRGEAAYELAVLAMDRIGDTPHALTWLQTALEQGFQHPDLVRRLERIRSARGEWRQVVSLMLERAEAMDSEQEAVELLMRAARVALYAHNHHDDAAAILLRVLLRSPERRDALRFLARYHARAGRDERALALYARLAPHEERGREQESVELRVADNVDYARLLLRNDRPRGAQLCLEAALDLNPSHVPTLALASQLSYNLGKWDEARVATEGLVRAFSSAEADGTYCAALRRLGNLAWLAGDLTTASEHFNRVLELAPDDAESWWGRAKVALAGHAGRVPNQVLLERPWLTAAPVRITPHEALARLLAALVQRPAMERWLALDPMGVEMLALLEGQADLVLALAAVDLMVARQLVRGALFRRLAAARPLWERQIQAVHELWFAPLSKRPFAIGECYRWAPQGSDFDVRHHRDLHRLNADPDGPVDVRPSLSTLHHPSAWKALLRWSGELAPPPEAEVIEAGEGGAPGASAILVLFPDQARSDAGAPAQRVLRVDDGDRVGADTDEATVPLAGLEPEHLRFERIGDTYYVRALGPLTIDGLPVTQRRLFGGERLKIGPIEARFFLYEEDLAAAGLGVATQRPTLGQKPEIADDYELDEELTSAPKAALFYTDGAHERMVPLVGGCVGVFEDAAGALIVEREGADADTVVLQRQGVHYLRDGDEPTARVLHHGDQFVVGSRLVHFRKLDQLEQVSVPVDLGELWGTPSDMPLLVYDDGSRHGRPIPLDRSPFTLGRGRDADFQIRSDAELSRVHCRFVRDGDVVWVEDAGSSNGTQLNGALLEGRGQLQPGDVVTIGATHLQFTRPDQMHAAARAELLPDLSTDETTDVRPVGQLARGGLPVDEGRDKVQLVNRCLGALFREIDAQEGSGRGQAFLENLVAARPRAYQGLLDDVDVRQGMLPAMDVLYNLAQRPEAEQRPLLNFVLRDVVDRVVDAAGELLEDAAMDRALAMLAELRYRDHLRF